MLVFERGLRKILNLILIRNQTQWMEPPRGAPGNRTNKSNGLQFL